MAEIPPVTLKIKVDTGALAEVLPLLRELQQIVKDFGKQRVTSNLARDAVNAAKVTREELTRIQQIQQMIERVRQRNVNRDLMLGAQALEQLTQQKLSSAQAAQLLAAAEEQAAKSGMVFVEALAAQLRTAGIAEDQIRAVTQAFVDLNKQVTNNISTFNSGKVGGYISVIGGYAGLVPGMPPELFMPIQRIGFIQALGRSSSLAVSTVVKLGALVAAIGGTFAFLYQSMNRYIQLEEKLIRIRLASGTRMTEGSILGQLSRIASSLGMKYSLTQIADAVLELTRSGMKLEEAFGGAAQTALRFARVAEIDVKQAVMDLVSLSAQLSLPFERVADIIAKVADMTSSSMAYIADAFSAAASSAESLGLSAEELGAFIAILDKAAVRGPEAGTALRAFFSSLSAIQGDTMTQQQRETLVRLNMSTQVFLLQRGLISVMDFVKALLQSGASAADLMVLFERRGERAASALRKFLSEFGDFTKSIQDSEGQMKKMAEALENSINAIREKIVNIIDQAMTSLGQKIVRFFTNLGAQLFAPEAAHFAKGLQMLADFLEKMRQAGISPRNIPAKDLGEVLYDWLRRFGSSLPQGKLAEALKGIIESAEASGIPQETIVQILDEIMKLIREELKRFPLSMSWGNRPWREIAAELEQVQKELTEQYAKKIKAELERAAAAQAAEAERQAKLKQIAKETYWDVAKKILANIGDDFKQAVDSVMMSEEVLGIGNLLSRLFQDMTQRIGKHIRDEMLVYFTKSEEGKKFVQGILDAIFGNMSYLEGNNLLQNVLKALGITSFGMSDTLPKILASVLAGVFVDLGNILVSVITRGLQAFLQSLRGAQRGRAASWGQVQYMRTGQGIVPTRMYSPTFAPTVHIGTINVNSSALGREHDAIASVLYSQIQRAALFAVESASTTMAYAFEGMEDF